MSETIVARLRRIDSIELVGILTIVLLLAREVGWSYPFVVVLGAAALVHRPLLHRGEVWLGIATLRLLLFPLSWASIENADYLVTWWCLAMGVALLLRDPERAVAISARWLLGGVFLLAMYWKLASPDFPNGGFFAFSIVSDLRLEAIAHAAGVSQETIFANRATLLSMLQPGGPEVVSLAGVEAVGVLGRVMTIGTLVIEGLVALTLLARPWFPDWFRNGLLVVFVLVTYALAPILLFGWIVLILAIAQTHPHETVARATFAGLFVALPGLAYVATLREAAVPTFAGLLAAALFIAYVRGAGPSTRDAGIVLGSWGLGQLAEVGGIDRAALMGSAVGLLAVAVLRLQEGLHRRGS